jgi:FAD synthase
LDGKIKKGMLSIGERPTLNRPGEKVEVNIFDFDQDIYGKILRVTVRKFLREQIKYDSLDLLIEQLHKDKENSLEVL